MTRYNHKIIGDDDGRCTKCGKEPALDNETKTCQECEDRALEALMVGAMRGFTQCSICDEWYDPFGDRAYIHMMHWPYFAPGD